VGILEGRRQCKEFRTLPIAYLPPLNTRDFLITNMPVKFDSLF
jgi:hypothetical protein